MPNFETSKLWSRGLSSGSADTDVHRERLRSAFLRFHKNAAELASEIGRDIPTLTVHDIEHIDALWIMADIIIGDVNLDGPEPFLNPLETFVLGGAFLIHDLAHSRAALPLSDTEVRNDPLYSDILSDVLGESNTTFCPRDTKESTAAEHEETLRRYLRASHAKGAENLPLRFWQDDQGVQHYLIEDRELRDTVGEAIGRIAASHHLPTSKLPDVFAIRGGPVSLPPRWKVDELKLACIIRLADAAQIDARRAPTFLKLFRKPEGMAKLHWDFQQKINQPIPEGDKLIFSSGSSFSCVQADAWWVGHDLLQVLERELAEVDALLSDNNRPRFAVRTVAGIHDPQRLSKYIPTNGWRPIDTQIRVGNVAGLVTRLGGAQLYGKQTLAPLRELIQNASDAIRSRRLIEGLDCQFGAVEVALQKTDGAWILSVTDDGVGMSETVLTGPMLDFGTSFWRSELASKEYLGLKGKGFEPTGRYGIGFFSVFMLGKRVKVISRRYDLGASDARVLEFYEGALSRPILRTPTLEERSVCGTRIEIRLTHSPRELGGLLKSTSHDTLSGSLADVCAWLCPTSDVDIITREGEKPGKCVVKSSDWKSIPADKLLKRVEKIDYSGQAASKVVRDRHAINLRPLYSETGEMIGRASLRLESEDEVRTFHDCGVITVGGARAQNDMNLAGVVTGFSTKASRDSAGSWASEGEVRRWAGEQRELIEASEIPNDVKINAANILRSSGLEVGSLPLAQCSSGWLSEDGIRSLALARGRIIMTTHLHMKFGATVAVDQLSEEVILTAHGSGGGLRIIDNPLRYSRSKWPKPDYWAASIEGLIARALASAWACSLAEVMKAADHSDDDHTYSGLVGTDKFGNAVLQNGLTIFYRPGVPRDLPVGYEVADTLARD